MLLLYFTNDPFIRNSHKVSLHGQLKSFSVLWRLDHSGLCLPRNHSPDRLAHPLHSLDDVILPHVINNPYHHLVSIVVKSDQNGIVNDIDYGEKQCIVQNCFMEEHLAEASM